MVYLKRMILYTPNIYWCIKVDSADGIFRESFSLLLLEINNI